MTYEEFHNMIKQALSEVMLERKKTQSKKHLIFYVNKSKKTIVCYNPALNIRAKVKLAKGDRWDEYTGKLAAYIKCHNKPGLSIINDAQTIYQDDE